MRKKTSQFCTCNFNYWPSPSILSEKTKIKEKIEVSESNQDKGLLTSLRNENFRHVSNSIVVRNEKRVKLLN